MIGLLMRISRGAHQFQASGKYNTPLPHPPRTTPLPRNHAYMPAADAFSRAGTRAHNPPITLWLQPMFARDFPLLLGLLSAPLPSLERPVVAPSCHAWTAGWRETSCYPNRAACIQFLHQDSRGESHVE